MQAIEDMCRANLEDHVADPELRERLRPDYRAACKRLVVSPNFYEAIQRPNARLVTDGIERVEPTGVRTVDGVLHELDVLVLATGFRVDRFMRPISVVGRAGQTLDDAWAKRPFAYLALSIPDFPNLFMLNGPNGPVGNFSLIEVAEIQVGYIMQLVERLRRRRGAVGVGHRGGNRPVRGRAARGGQEHDLGHGLPELVPRRPGRPRRVALAVHNVPSAHGRTRLRGLRHQLRAAPMSPRGGAPRAKRASWKRRSEKPEPQRWRASSRSRRISSFPHV